MTEAAPALEERIRQAQNRLQARYAELSDSGGWRTVAQEVGMNLRFVFEFASKGTLPVREDLREKLLNWRKHGNKGQPWTQYPEGLEKAILEVLNFHEGRDQAIGRGELVAILERRGYQRTERTMREAIKQLRRRGHLICAMPGEDGGYYLAASLEEFEEFDRLEFGAKIADMSETRQAMCQAARRKFGEGYQMELLP